MPETKLTTSMSYVIYASPSASKRQLIKQEAATERLAKKWEMAFRTNGWTVFKVVEVANVA